MSCAYLWYILLSLLEFLGEVKRWCNDEVRGNLNIDVLLEGFFEEAKEERFDLIILLPLSL